MLKYEQKVCNRRISIIEMLPRHLKKWCIVWAHGLGRKDVAGSLDETCWLWEVLFQWIVFKKSLYILFRKSAVRTGGIKDKVANWGHLKDKELTCNSATNHLMINSGSCQQILRHSSDNLKYEWKERRREKTWPGMRVSCKSILSAVWHGKVWRGHISRKMVMQLHSAKETYENRPRMLNHQVNEKRILEYRWDAKFPHLLTELFQIKICRTAIEVEICLQNDLKITFETPRVLSSWVFFIGLKSCDENVLLISSAQLDIKMFSHHWFENSKETLYYNPASVLKDN